MKILIVLMLVFSMNLFAENLGTDITNIDCTAKTVGVDTNEDPVEPPVVPPVPAAGVTTDPPAEG